MERNRGRGNSIYESPLSGLKKSLEELNSLVGSIVYNGDKRLTRGMLKLKLSKQNATHSSRKASSRNSVIVINDSDNETNDGDGDNNDDETNDRNKKDASLSIIKCKLKSPLPLQRKKRSRISTKQVVNRSSISLDNDSSVILLSDTQETLLHGENIESSKTADDVVELWSCLKNSTYTNKDEKNARCNRDATDNETEMFVIDKRPNLKYLKILKPNTESIPKRAKKQKNILLSRDKTSSIENINQRQYSNKNQRKRKRNDNLDSSLTESNAHHNKKKINSYKKNSSANSRSKLREIIIDGCNVAMAHTNGKEFSEKGIQIVVNYFKSRGHIVKVFLPQHVRRKKYSYLEQLYKEGIVVFTPSRKIAGRQITSYDDRYILKYATSCGGIVISSDQYRDLYWEKPEWRNTILNRLLIPTFVGDYIMFPEDPLGKSGPNLETFLQH